MNKRSHQNVTAQNRDYHRLIRVTARELSFSATNHFAHSHFDSRCLCIYLMRNIYMKQVIKSYAKEEAN